MIPVTPLVDEFVDHCDSFNDLPDGPDAQAVPGDAETTDDAGTSGAAVSLTAAPGPSL